MNYIRSSYILSRLSAMLRRKGALTLAFENSVTLRVLDAIVLAVPRAFGAIYRAAPDLWDGAYIIGLVRDLGSKPEILFSWFVFTLLIVPQSYLYSNYTFAFSLLLLFVFLVIFWVSVGFGRQRAADNPRLSLKNFGFWLTIYAIVIIIYVPVSYDIRTSLVKALPRYIICVIILYVCFASRWTMRGIRRVLNFCVFGVLVSALFGFYQRLAGHIQASSSSVDLSIFAGMPGRIYSFYENPNTYGFMLVLFLPLCLACFLAARNKYSRAFAGLTFLCGAVVLIMTYSRGPWLAFAVEIFIFTLLIYPRLVPYLAAAVVIALPLLPDMVFTRILTIFFGDSSLSSRAGVYDAALALFYSRPLGVGLGLEIPRQYIYAHNLYDTLRYPAYYQHAHNFLLQPLNETGIGGTLALFGSMFFCVKAPIATQIPRHGAVADSQEQISRHDAVADSQEQLFGAAADTRVNESKLIAVAGLCALVGILICGIVDYPISYPRVMLLMWLVFGITFVSSSAQTST